MSNEKEGTEKNPDVLQVGLPEFADNLLKEIHRDTQWFSEEMDIYKVAVAVALSHGWERKDGARFFDGGIDTKFRVILLDPDGKLKRIVELLVPACGDAPYKYSQWLATSGVNYLHKELVTNGRTLVDVLELEEKND